MSTIHKPRDNQATVVRQLARLPASSDGRLFKCPSKQGFLTIDPCCQIDPASQKVLWEVKAVGVILIASPMEC